MKKIRPLFWVRVLEHPVEGGGKPLAQFEKHKEYPVLGVVWSEDCVYVVNDNGGIHQVDLNRCIVSRQQFNVERTLGDDTAYTGYET